MISAILLAAGQSKRLKSENKLIKLYKKIPLINYSLKVLQKSKVNRIIIVLGHQNKEVKKVIKSNKKNIALIGSKLMFHIQFLIHERWCHSAQRVFFRDFQK